MSYSVHKQTNKPPNIWTNANDYITFISSESMSIKTKVTLLTLLFVFLLMFQEFLFFALPLINIRRMKNYVMRQLLPRQLAEGAVERFV